MKRMQRIGNVQDKTRTIPGAIRIYLRSLAVSFFASLRAIPLWVAVAGGEPRDNAHVLTDAATSYLSVLYQIIDPADQSPTYRVPNRFRKAFVISVRGSTRRNASRSSPSKCSASTKKLESSSSIVLMDRHFRLCDTDRARSPAVPGS